MSLQWTLIAFIMYIELGGTVFLLLPFISPQRWNGVFKSRFLRSIKNMSHVYFKVFLAILVLFFIDAIREMRKYGSEIQESKQGHTHLLDAEMQAQMRLFRSQRNFYISGFSLFLWIVIQRLAVLISRIALVEAEKEAAMKQAISASAAASALMKDGEKPTKGEEAKEKKEIQALKEDVRRLKAESEAALKQASSVGDEYDRLMGEHAKVQLELKKAVGDDTSKKSD